MLHEQILGGHLRVAGELRIQDLPKYSTIGELQATNYIVGQVGKYTWYKDGAGDWHKILIDSDIDTSTILGGANSSDGALPSQKSVKTYVDNQAQTLTDAIATAVSNAVSTLNQTIGSLRKITPWNPSNAFPTTRIDSLPFKEGDFVQITNSVGNWKAGDVIIATVDGATQSSQFVDANINVDVATATTNGTVMLIASLAELNNRLPANDGKVITQAVLMSKLDEVLQTITTAYTNADTALQNAITTAYTNAINTAKAQIETAYQAADSVLQGNIDTLANRVTSAENTLVTLGQTVSNHEGRITALEASSPKLFSQTLTFTAGEDKTITHSLGKQVRFVVVREATSKSIIMSHWEVDSTDSVNKILVSPAIAGSLLIEALAI